ncbi:hypothetical protein Tco_1313662 [Tanacetum coccineum]
MASDHVSSNPAPQRPITALEHDSLSLNPQSQANVPLVVKSVTTSFNKLDMLFSHMFDEYFNGASIVVSKSSTFYLTKDGWTYDKPSATQTQTHPTINNNSCMQICLHCIISQTSTEPTIQASTQELTVTASENINLADIQAETQE